MSSPGRTRSKGAVRPAKGAAPVEEPEVTEEVEGEVIEPGAGDVEAADAEIVDADAEEESERGRREAREVGRRTGLAPRSDGGLAGALVPVDSLQRYLAEIRRYPLLDVEEEHELAVRWREKGDREA